MLKSVRAYIRDVRRMGELAANRASLARYAVDRFLSMLLGRILVPGRKQLRRIHLQSGVCLNYRLDRGDMQAIREVWLDGAYRLPSEGKRKVLVDLGANIGLASLWLARRYGCETIVAVEPVPANALLTRLNLERNGIGARVVECAVGATDGKAMFEERAESNLGHISTTGREVSLISMPSLLQKFIPETMVDLLKIDIEGGEEAVLGGSQTQWLDRIQEIIVEFHPTIVNYPALVGVLQKAGFEYLAAGTAFPGSMDYFRRLKGIPKP